MGQEQAVATSCWKAQVTGMIDPQNFPELCVRRELQAGSLQAQYSACPRDHSWGPSKGRRGTSERKEGTQWKKLMEENSHHWLPGLG